MIQASHAPRGRYVSWTGRVLGPKDEKERERIHPHLLPHLRAYGLTRAIQAPQLSKVCAAPGEILGEFSHIPST